MKRILAAAAVIGGVLAGCDGRAPSAASPAADDRPSAETPAQAADHAAAPAAAAATLAAPDAPAFAALYPGATMQDPPLTADGPDGPGGVAVFLTEATPDAVIDFYRERSAAAGLSPVMGMSQGGARAYGAAGQGANGASLSVVASPLENGATSVQLTWSAGG